MFRRLDMATLHYMGEAEKHVDNETFNLSLEAGLGHRLKYCLWGNVVKDPRSALKQVHTVCWSLVGPLIYSGTSV